MESFTGNRLSSGDVGIDVRVINTFPLCPKAHKPTRQRDRCPNLAPLANAFLIKGLPAGIPHGLIWHTPVPTRIIAPGTSELMDGPPYSRSVPNILPDTRYMGIRTHGDNTYVPSSALTTYPARDEV